MSALCSGSKLLLHIKSGAPRYFYELFIDRHIVIQRPLNSLSDHIFSGIWTTSSIPRIILRMPSSTDRIRYWNNMTHEQFLQSLERECVVADSAWRDEIYTCINTLSKSHTEPELRRGVRAVATAKGRSTEVNGTDFKHLKSGWLNTRFDSPKRSSYLN